MTEDDAPVKVPYLLCGCGPHRVCYEHRTINGEPVTPETPHMDPHDIPTGTGILTHSDGRDCFHDLTWPPEERWRTGDRRCIRAHRAMLEDDDEQPFQAEDWALADLAEVLSTPMRTRLRELLADAAR